MKFYEHIHKNLWLVQNREGLEMAAALVRGGGHFIAGSMLSCSKELKYPCGVFLNLRDYVVYVDEYITDTTMRETLRRLEQMRNV